MKYLFSIGMVLIAAGCQQRAGAAPQQIAPPAVADECVDPPDAMPAHHALAALSSAEAHGIDVSHFNTDVPWRSLRDAGLTYVFVKASEGKKTVDPAYRDHWEAAKRCKLLRGAYHFLHPELDPIEQAHHFLKIIGDDRGELPIVVDVERGLSGSKKECKALEAVVRKYVEEIERATGQKVMIYSGHAFWTQQLCNTKAFSDRPLWLAHYSDEPPQLFGGWVEWEFWQFTDHARLTKMNFDLNRSSRVQRRLTVSSGGQK